MHAKLEVSIKFQNLKILLLIIAIITSIFTCMLFGTLKSLNIHDTLHSNMLLKTQYNVIIIQVYNPINLKFPR